MLHLEILYYFQMPRPSSAAEADLRTSIIAGSIDYLVVVRVAWLAPYFTGRY